MSFIDIPANPWRQLADGWIYMAGRCAQCGQPFPPPPFDAMRVRGGNVMAMVHVECIYAFNAAGAKVPDPPKVVDPDVLAKLRRLIALSSHTYSGRVAELPDGDGQDAGEKHEAADLVYLGPEGCGGRPEVEQKAKDYKDRGEQKGDGHWKVLLWR